MQNYGYNLPPKMREALGYKVKSVSDHSHKELSAAEVLRLVFWMLTKYAGMSGLAFWTNIMFVLLTCARGWAGLTLYKTQEETL